MMREPIIMRFHYASRLRYPVEWNPPTLECHWMPPEWLRWINRAIQRWFTVADYRMEEMIKTRNIDTRVLLDAILESKHRIEAIYNRRCRGVLVGPRQMGQLDHECQPMRFEVSVRLGGQYGTKIFGIPIEVVPWMDGILLLPLNP